MELDEKQMLAILAFVYFFTHLPLISYIPFVLDESLYSVMVSEQIVHLTIVPTYLGNEVGWKPPLFFWIYSAMVAPISNLPIPLEAIFRIPSFLFGLVNVFLVYLIIKKIHPEKKVAFVTSLIYSCIFLNIYINNTILIDTLNLTFILAGVYCYMNSSWDERRFVVGAAFAILAFFTKFWIALMVPFLALAYLYFENKKIISNRVFLLSLLAVPVAFILYSSFFVQPGVPQQDSGLEYMIRNRILLPFTVPIEELNYSFGMFFVLTSIWLGFGIYGAIKKFKGNEFMLIWFALIIFPMLGGRFLPWYYLPVMIPIAFFSALVMLEHKGKIVMDLFCISITALLLIVGIAFGLLFFSSLNDSFIGQKTSGELVAYKENVVILGAYCPSIIAYKVLEEKRKFGNAFDFGWVIIGNELNDSVLEDFLKDHHLNSTSYPIHQNGFSEMFTLSDEKKSIIRKDTDVIRPDYVVICKHPDISVSGTLLLNQSSVRVFKIR